MPTDAIDKAQEIYQIKVTCSAQTRRSGGECGFRQT